MGESEYIVIFIRKCHETVRNEFKRSRCKQVAESCDENKTPSFIHGDYYLLTYLLTPWCRVPLEQLTGLQLVNKFPAFHGTPKVHYRTHKRPPPVSILGQQSNPVHIHTSHLLEIHTNFIHPSTPRSPQWSLSLRFPHQEPIQHPLLTHTRHMPSPSHSSRFYHPHKLAVHVSDINALSTKRKSQLNHF